MLICFCGVAHGPGQHQRGLFAPADARGGAARPGSAGKPDPAMLEDLVAANHILFHQGVVDGFGHVSMRHDKDPGRYLLARSMAPALVTADDIMEYDLDSNPVDPAGRKSYLERFIHGEIYKARPDVGAVVHSHSPAVIPFADTRVKLRPMNHIASFLGSGVPVFEIRDSGGDSTDMLIRNGGLGRALATSLGGHDVALMRGHGSVAVGRDVRRVVFRAIYTEVNARMQSEAIRLAASYGGEPEYLSDGEANSATATNDGVIDRPWELWKSQAMGG